MSIIDIFTGGYEEQRLQKTRTKKQKREREKAMRGRKVNVQRLIAEKKR